MAKKAGVRAGRIFWDVDVAKADAAKKKVQQLGSELNKALNSTGRSNTGLSRVGAEADATSQRVRRLQDNFARLKAQFDLGQIDTQKYTARLKDLESGIQRTGRQAGLTASQMKGLATVNKRVQREQATLGGSTAAVNKEVSLLVTRIGTLRNNWQKTGEATNAVKRELRELGQQTDRLQQSLAKADGGTQRFNRQIRQLATAGRSAEATIAGIEGRMSRLGLASQVNLAATNALTNGLYRLGPAGQVAAGSLGIVSGGMGTLSVGAGIAGGAILGVGLAAASLTRRGIPQVKELQTALRVLVASGEDFDQVKLDDALRAAADAAGEAGKQFSRAQIATALAEIVKAGVPANEAIRLLAPGMQLAAVTGQSLNDSTSSLLGNLRQFGLTTADAQRAADALATADLAAAHGAAELSQGLAVVGPIARAANISLEDTLGILVELDNKGLNPADKGATALRGTMSALLDPTAEATSVLDRLGVSLKDADGRSRPLLDVLQELQRALSGNSEAAQAAAKIFDTRAITAILNMSDASSELAQNLKNSQGAAEAYANTFLDENLAAAQNELKVSLDNLSATFTTTFAGNIASAANALSDFLDQVDKIVSNPNKWETAAGLVNLLTGSDTVRRMLGLPTQDEIQGFKNYVYGSGGSSPGGGSETGSGSSGGRAGTQETPPPPPPVPALADAIQRARELKAALDAATKAADAEAWAHATENVQKFTSASEQNALAWQAVAATSTTSTRKVRENSRTIQDIFDDLNKGGVQAQKAAEAQQNTLTAKADSLRARLKLVRTALAELLAQPDVNQGDNPDKVSYLLNRAEQLNAELEDTQKTLDDLTNAQARAEAAAREARDRIVGSNRTATGAGLIARRERARLEALTPTPAEVTAAEEANARIGASLAEATERGRRQTAERLRRTQQARGLAASLGIFVTGGQNDIFSDAQIAAIESAARIIGGLNTATEAGLRATEDRAKRERDLTAALEARDRVVRSLNEATTGGALTQLQRTRQARGLAASAGVTAPNKVIYTDKEIAALESAVRIINSLNSATERGATAADNRKAAEERVNQAWQRQADILGQLSDATERGRQATEDSNSSIEVLQQRLLTLQRNGVDPASEAVQRLVRQIGALNLLAAQKDLAENGVQNISDFSRAVLEAKGIIPKMTQSTGSLLERLQAIGGTTGGLAKFVQGLKDATKEGASTEDIVGGVATAVEGLNEALKGTASTKDLIKSVGSGIAEIAGTAAGIPGLGKVFSAVFDLGDIIVQSITDSFTGDSPAARALRESMTPAITTAFTTGIINGLKGAEGWQENLKDSVKLVFLQSLIEAFINGAIIQTYLQPIIDEYSKLIAKGDVQAAKEYLATALPPALDAATNAAEGFVQSIPPGLAPSGPGSSPGSSSASGADRRVSIPTATTTVLAAPAFVGQFGGFIRQMGGIVGDFGSFVHSLQEQGITVHVVTGGGSGGGASVATARSA